VDVFGNHGLCGLLEEGAHEKPPKCLGWKFRGFWGILQRSHIGGLYGVVFCKSGSAGIGLYCRPLKFSTSDFP
ncbi:hypothetical protein, partial [Eikenella corrodens]|uniref:hypothetical protein n=1 Tax=Eikenella corrodens TaxID=539 RepID=UPI001959FF08